MNQIQRIVLILTIAVSCVSCDQVTKAVAVNYLQGVSGSFFGDTVRLQLTYNSGAFLSLGDSLPKLWREVIFSAAAAGVVSALLAYALFTRTLTRTTLVAYALLIAGGIGNLADRLLHGGRVIDFINIGIGPLRTGIFNIADVAISVGVIMLIVTLFDGRREPKL